MTIYLYIVLFILNIIYPIATYLATATLTPIFFVLLAIMAAFGGIAVVISILLLSHDGFYY